MFAAQSTRTSYMGALNLADIRHKKRPTNGRGRNESNKSRIICHKEKQSDGINVGLSKVDCAQNMAMSGNLTLVLPFLHTMNDEMKIEWWWWRNIKMNWQQMMRWDISTFLCNVVIAIACWFNLSSKNGGIVVNTHGHRSTRSTTKIIPLLDTISFSLHSHP